VKLFSAQIAKNLLKDKPAADEVQPKLETMREDYITKPGIP